MYAKIIFYKTNSADSYIIASAQDKPIDPLVATLVKKGYAPMVDAVNKYCYSHFYKNRESVHRLYSFDLENRVITDYVIDELKESMQNAPDLFIHFNHDDVITDEMWKAIYDWLEHHLLGMMETDLVAIADQWMQPPFTDAKELEIVAPEVLPDAYGYKEHYLEDKDIMLYEVIKPNTDRPYISVTREFSKVGHLPFYTSLFVSQSWGVSLYDISFLGKVWKHKEMDGEFNAQELYDDRVKRCIAGEKEPEVYRQKLEEVIKRFY
jgi:hypothetical protein